MSRRMSAPAAICVAAAGALFAIFHPSAMAQDPVTAFPKNYSVAIDNSVVEVVRVHYGPHEKVAVHDHSDHPTIYVYLSDSGPVRFEHSEDPPITLTRPPLTLGSFRVSPGRRERHSVENLGDLSSDFLRVELKQVPLGTLKEFRGDAPQNLLQSQDSMMVTGPKVEVERAVCVGASKCTLKSSPAPSLLIAFAASDVMVGGRKEKLAAGAARWVGPSEEITVTTPNSGSAAHILRILIPSK